MSKDCASGCPLESFIRDGMKDLRGDVRDMRTAQDTMKTELHQAVLGNTTAIAGLDSRVQGVETSMRNLKTTVRSEARRWGAVGGIATSAAALIVGLLKAAFLPGHTG